MAEEIKHSSPNNKTVQSKDGAWPGAFAVCGQIFQQIKKNPAPAVFFVVTYIVFSIISSLAQGKGYGTAGYHDYQDLLQLVFLLAIPTYGLALADRRSISVNQVMEFDPRRFVALFLATILYVLAIFFSIILLIAPVIWAVGWFSLYEFPVVEHGSNAIEALKESKRLAYDHKGKVWGIVGAVIVLSLPEAILLLIPVVQYISFGYSMLIGVVSSGVFAALYRHLQAGAKA
jgi:hypothetical protein